MDISSDAVRRALRDIDSHHRGEMVADAETLDRLQEAGAPQDTWDVVTGGANLTTWMKVGGVAVLTSAVLAACGGDDAPAASPTTAAPEGATTTLAGGSRLDPNDLSVFRFAASAENLFVELYAQGIKLVTTPATLELATLFQTHHSDHAELFNGQLLANGQKEITEPNSVLLGTFKPRIDSLRTEADVLRLAQEVELAAASTYLSTVGVLKGEKLGYTAMTVGASEYRHAALLSFLTNTPIASTRGGFLTTTEAIVPTGV